MTADRTASRGAGRERLVVLALGVVGAALALLTATRGWVDVRIANPLAGGGRLHPDGRDAAPLVPAAALVALAASVAAVTLRRVGRQVAGLLLVASGAAIGSAAVTVLSDPRSAAAEAVRTATGRTDLTGVTASAGSWPWAAVVAAVLVVLAGVLTILRGRGWSGLSSRYDAPAAAERPVDADESAAWDALTRGEDPTR